MVYPAAWVRIPLAPPVAGSLPDDLRGWGIPQPEMKMLSGVLAPLGSPTWNISTDGQCLQLITETTKVQIFYVPPALRTCRKGLKPFLVIYRSKKSPFGMAAPIKNQPATQSSRWSTVLISHRTPVISERLSKSAGFIDSNQSINSSGMIFFFGVPPLTAFHIPGKAPGTYRHRLYGLPRIPLPGHTRKIEFPKMMSSYKFSLCGSNLSFAGILFFDSI